MIYSKKLKLVFVKGRKVAGTSIEILLSQLCGPEDVITPIMQVDELLRYRSGGLMPQNYGADGDELRQYHEDIKRIAETGGDQASSMADKLVKPRGHLQNHSSLRKLLRNHAGVPDDFRMFCVVRSPYAKMISLANMAVTLRQYKEGASTLNATDERIGMQIDYLFGLPDGPSCHDIQLYRVGGSIPERMTIIRYENLADDLTALLKERGVENPPALPNAKPGRRSETLDVRAILKPHQIEKINDFFADEFEEFGFEKLVP